MHLVHQYLHVVDVSVWQAGEVIGRLAPDVAVLDFNLPDGSGGDLIERFTVELPELRCVIFTSLVDQAETDALLAAGAEAVVLKTLRGTDLVDAIRRVGKSSSDARGSAPAS